MNKSPEFSYPGRELDLFALAENWKLYVKSEITEYLVGNVLEIGAGVGGTTVALHDGSSSRWLCLEPDSEQAKRLHILLARDGDINAPVVVAGTLAALAEKPAFDCILYIDVLEHIDDDRLQIETAAKLVRRGGYLVILSPAHQWLFSEFDRSIGHRRRYNKQSLRKLIPETWLEKKMVYLDSLGILFSLANVIALRQSLPTQSQIIFWDRLCMPISRAIDRLTLGVFGKSILAVWQNPVKR